MSTGMLFWILTMVICAFFLWISYRFKGEASKSFSNYAIGGASFGMLLIFFTQFASIMGVSNFFSHAGNGYVQGVGILAFILGEQGAKIVFALVFVGLIGKFTYNTMPELIDDLIVRDKITRALCSILASMIMIASVGSQGKAFGDLFQVFTGVNPVPIVFVFSAIFIIYTVMGGVYSVIWTDLFQGILCVVVGVIFYIYAFGKIDFSFSVLSERLAAVGKEELLNFTGLDFWATINKFVTGLLGVLIFQAYWQRCFACKTAKTAKRSMLYSGIICMVMVCMTAMVGPIIMTYNQGLDANTAMPWFMMNCMPTALCAAVFVLVLCAGMSTADSCLNSSAVLIVNDLIHPFSKADDRNLIRDAKIITVIIGVISCICGIYASTVLSLLSRAYALAGAGVVPLLCIGLIWRERKAPHAMGKRNSRVTPWGARCGVVVGAISSQLPCFGENATLIGFALSSLVVVIVSLLTKNIKSGFESEGYVHTASEVIKKV